MQTLDLAAGLRVIRPRVAGPDAKALQLRLEEHLALARATAEYRGVVGQKGCGISAALCRVVEDADDIGRSHRAEGRRRDQQTRVVVDHIEDLDGPSVGEGPVRRV